jgi:apolipoprotein D and lipocalin family protein
MIMRMGYGIFTAALMAVFVGAAGAAPKAARPLDTVGALDVQRYLGRWYEIARFQHGFEKSIVGATADYSLNGDGTVAVVNSGFKKSLDGKYTAVKAVARVPDPAEPGKLKVKFFGLFEADYLVFGLDGEDYSWALVGDNKREFLWFLARTPEIDEGLFERMKSMAESQGYNLDGLYRVPQKAR